MRMLPTRLPETFRHTFPPPAAIRGQQVGQTAAAALILALAALSIRLTLTPDFVARFSHMGYVGGFVMNAISSATVFLPMPGVLHTLAVVQMPSRNRSGEFLGSNRLQRNLAASDTQPPSIDRGVAVIRFDGQSTDSIGQPWPRYWHAGGMQLVEDVLVVPLECCDCGWTWLLDPLRNWVRRDCTHRSMECPGNAGLALIDVRGFDLTHPPIQPQHSSPCFITKPTRSTALASSR
jgi:hypothetical protein